MDVLRITLKAYSGRRYCGEQTHTVLHQGDAQVAVDELIFQLDGEDHWEGEQLYALDRFELVAIQRVVSVAWATSKALADLAGLQPLKESQPVRD